MARDGWYSDADVLVDQLRECHRRATPVPQVSGYRDLVPLQGGGQGMVFLATRGKDGRRVALKVFHERSFDSPLARRRFEREITLVSRLVHPNVVRLHQYGTTGDGRPFLAMEFVHGWPLDEWLDGRSVDEVVELMLQICGALDHAHRRGVIHRDLKPGNVRVDPDGNARLLNFGLARPVKPTPDDLSLTGEFLGSLKWASPEQVAGHPDEVDTRTDIHALGLLLYHGLVGDFPYAVDGSVAQVVENIQRAPPRRFGKRVPGAHGDLETIVLRCLAKDPDRRYESVAEVARDLERFLDGEPIGARRDGWRFLLSSLVRGHPWASTAVGLAFVGLVVFSVVVSGLYTRAVGAEADVVDALAQKALEAERIATVNEFLLGSFVGKLPAGTDPEQVKLAPVLLAAAARIETAPPLADEPLVRADLHVAFAYWFYGFPERVEEATSHADQALALYAASVAEHPADALRVTAGLLPVSTQAAWAVELRGCVAMQAGDYEAARRDLLDALALYRAVCGDDANLARVLSHVATCAFALDDLDELEPQLLECRAIMVRRVGEGDPQVAGLDKALAHLRERLAGR